MDEIEYWNKHSRKDPPHDIAPPPRRKSRKALLVFWLALGLMLNMAAVGIWYLVFNGPRIAAVPPPTTALAVVAQAEKEKAPERTPPQPVRTPPKSAPKAKVGPPPELVPDTVEGPAKGEEQKPPPAPAPTPRPKPAPVPEPSADPAPEVETPEPKAETDTKKADPKVPAEKTTYKVLPIKGVQVILADGSKLYEEYLDTRKNGKEFRDFLEKNGRVHVVTAEIVVEKVKDLHPYTLVKVTIEKRTLERVVLTKHLVDIEDEKK